jgi:hypothetical protein
MSINTPAAVVAMSSASSRIMSVSDYILITIIVRRSEVPKAASVIKMKLVLLWPVTLAT